MVDAKSITLHASHHTKIIQDAPQARVWERTQIKTGGKRRLRMHKTSPGMLSGEGSELKASQSYIGRALPQKKMEVGRGEARRGEEAGKTF